MASESQANFENWIDQHVESWTKHKTDDDNEFDIYSDNIIDFNQGLHDRVADLKTKPVKDVFTDSLLLPIQKLRLLLDELENEPDLDSQITIVLDSGKGFIRGVSLLVVDPVIELVLNRVSYDTLITYQKYLQLS